MPCYPGLPVPNVINCAGSAPASLGQKPLRAASSRSPDPQAATPAGPAQLQNPPSPDTGESLEGKRLTQLPALSPESSPAAPASPGGARSWSSLAREPRPAGQPQPLCPLPAPARGSQHLDLLDRDYNSRRAPRPDQWRAPEHAGRGACAAV